MTASWINRDCTPDPTSSRSLTADEILAQAQAEAAIIRHCAEEQANELVTTTITTVRQEQLAAFTTASDELLQMLQRQWEASLQQLEQEAVLLVSDLVRDILHDHCAAHPEAILPVIREAMQRLSDSTRVQLMVAVAHEPVVRAAQTELLALLAPEARLNIVIANELEPGDCLLHGDRGSLDGRLATRLEILDQSLQEAVARQEVSDVFAD